MKFNAFILTLALGVAHSHIADLQWQLSDGGSADFNVFLAAFWYTSSAFWLYQSVK